MRRILLIVLLIVSLLSSAPVFAAQFMGGNGFLHSNSALVMPPGALDLSNYVRSYISLFHAGVGYSVSNATSALSTTFGYSNNLEVGFSQILYQSLNLTNREFVPGVSSMVPGDTYIRFKFGGYQFTPNLFWGIMPNIHYRVGEFHDVQLEPYASNNIELEVMFLMTYLQKPLYPNEGRIFHFNYSITNHRDLKPITKASQSINFLFGFLQPRSNKSDIGVELYGSIFYKRPAIEIFSRENWVYITPMFKHKIFRGMRFTIGLDYLLVGSKNTTNFTDAADDQEDLDILNSFPNYPSWRLTTRINFIPSTSFFSSKSSNASSGRHKRVFGGKSASGEGTDRQSLFKWAVEERGGEIEAIDVDLAKIRQERKNAEAELEILKKDLEKRKKK